MTRTVTLSLVITSCGGTFSVTVRRSILTIRSTIGIRKIRPGPFWAISRPSRKITPRSYSRRILTPEPRGRTPRGRRGRLSLSRPPRRSFLVIAGSTGTSAVSGASAGLTSSVSPSTDSTLTLLPRSRVATRPRPTCEAGAPQGALDEDLPDRVERLADLAHGADELLPARVLGQAARPDRPAETATARRPPRITATTITTGAEISKALEWVS